MKLHIVRIILTLVAILFRFSGLAQVYSQNDFKETAVPHFQSNEWFRLDTSSKNFFSVSIIDGHLQITAYKPSAINEYSLANGKLLAINGGEWGGGLYYSP